MKRILCTGDSHTWGQGVTHLMEEFDPPTVAGDLRLASFRSGGYVNRLRRFVEQTTGSRSFEWSARELAQLANVPYVAPCAQLSGAPLTLSFTGSLLRVEYARAATPCVWELMVDGAHRDGGELPAATGENQLCLSHIHLDEGTHTLTLRAVEGILPLFRIESYAGDFAVINSGIGSCPTFRFQEEYFLDHAKAVKPAIVLAEAHTINDWIAGAPPAVYADRLEALLRAFQELGATVILMTVAPISGCQRWQEGPLYDAYNEAARQAAARLGVPVCDANRLMNLCIEGMTEEEKHTFLLDDPWHPNDRGHALYAEMLAQTLCQQGLLTV